MLAFVFDSTATACRVVLTPRVSLELKVLFGIPGEQVGAGSQLIAE